jgi:hypothetical protein
MALVITVSGNGMPLAEALTEKTIDPGLGCGNNWWGVKASSQPESNMYWFGKKTDCTVDPLHPTGYKGRTNVLAIHEFRPGDSTQKFATEWQAAIEGRDAWGNNGSLNNGKAPLVANTNFPAPATPPLGTAYNLKAQWLWTTDALPLTDQINANYLTNLWFCKVDGTNRCPSSSDYMVIDFMWMQLSSTGNSGTWQQSFPADLSSEQGTQYYAPYCDREDSTTIGVKTNVYHYPIVLDNTSHGSNQWIEKISNIDSYITDAFNHSYGVGGNGAACTHSIPDNASGHRSLFSITGQETGIELSAQNFGKSGRVEGGISNSDLYY